MRDYRFLKNFKGKMLPIKSEFFFISWIKDKNLRELRILKNDHHKIVVTFFLSHRLF